MYDKIVEKLTDALGISADEITPETTFESLGIDSLATVEMVMELEDELGVQLDLEEKLATVGELVAWLEEKVG